MESNIIKLNQSNSKFNKYNLGIKNQLRSIIDLWKQMLMHLDTQNVSIRIKI